MSRAQSIFIAFLIGVCIGLLVGAKSCATHTNTIRIDTLVTQLRDTIYRTRTHTIIQVVNGDSTRITEQQARDSSIHPFIAYGDTITTSDNAKIAPSFSYPEFKFSTYYKPKPDTTYRVTQTTSSPLTGWSFGVGVGYGMAEVDGVARVKPWVGVSLQKTLIGW